MTLCGITQLGCVATASTRLVSRRWCRELAAIDWRGLATPAVRTRAGDGTFASAFASAEELAESRQISQRHHRTTTVGDDLEHGARSAESLLAVPEERRASGCPARRPTPERTRPTSIETSLR